MVQAFPLFGQIQLFLEDFIAVKPDGVQRGLVGKIICRFEEKGFRLCAMKMTTASKDLLEMHFADLSSKPFFPKLVEFMLSGPVVAMVWEGKGAVKIDRKCLERLTLLILFLEQFVDIIVLTLGETYVMDLTLWKQQRKK